MGLLPAFILLALCHQINGAYNQIPNFTVSDDDMRNLVSMMRTNDQEKPDFCDVHYNYQETYDGSDKDMASQNLFFKVNPETLKKPTFAKLLGLRKFFNPTTGVAEQQSPDKEKAINDFFETVYKSGPFQWLVNFLKTKKHPWAASETTLKSAIKQIWFDNYSRARGKLDSSAFEHIFLGEEKNGEVSGPIMYDLEKTPNEKFNYRGFMKKRFDVIGEINLMWRGVEKRTGSFFAGSSPAFDFSVFTACFLAHRGKGVKCRFLLEGCEIQIQSYDMVQGDKVFIGTSYPEIGRPSPTCEQFYGKRKKCCKI